MNNKALGVELRFALSLTSPSSVFGRTALKTVSMFTDARALDEELEYVERVRGALGGDPALIDSVTRAISPFKDIRRCLSECGERPLSLLEAFELKCFLLQYEHALAPLGRLARMCSLDAVRLCDPAAALAVLDPSGERAPSFSVGGRFIDGIAAVREQKAELEKRISDGERELLDERARLAGAETRLEKKALAELSVRLAPMRDALLEAVSGIARVDMLIEKARLADKYGCGRPVLAREGVLLSDAVNPRIASRVGSFTPVSAELLPGCTVITGANMGGKTVALRTLALNVLLINCGFYPFARAARCPLFDEVLLILGDKQDDERGLSSFGGEVEELKKLTAALEEKYCFAAADEPAKGTNAREGAALAAAVCAYANRRKSVCVITTHYDGVANEGCAHYRVAGLDESCLKESSGDGAGLPARSMRYGLERVGRGEKCPDSALAVCRAMGLSDEITDRARQLLDERD